jgi:hypothetical protein
MAYSVPKSKIQKPEFDESKWFKSLKLKEVSEFKNLDNPLQELQSLSDYDICAKLGYYVKSKNLEKVTFILTETDIDPNFTDKSGNSPLHYAVFYGLVDITGKLIYYGADNNFVNKRCETATEAGRVSIQENITKKKYIKNNSNIENCIQLIENWNGRIKIDELKQDININSIRDNLNKIQEENKTEILKIIIQKSKNIIDDKKKISTVFDMIFKMAQDNDLYLSVYVEVVKSILTLDRSYNLARGLLHIFLGKAFEFYIKALQEPTAPENQNIIKFITHFYPDLMTRRFLQKIIEDLFYVIEQSYDSKSNILEEQECIRLLQTVLIKVKSSSNKSCKIKYEERIKKFLEPKYNLKLRLKFLIEDYLELTI